MVKLVKVAKIKEGDIKHKYVWGGMGGGVIIAAIT